MGNERHSDAPRRDSRRMGLTGADPSAAQWTDRWRQFWPVANGKPGLAKGPAADNPAELLHVSSNKATRGLLWIDAVGGYLICLNDQVVLGQSIPGNEVDIPILGDLSSHHATIHRGDEGYVLDPHALVRISGRELRGPAALQDGDRLRLGERVELRFRRPNPLSNTARLEWISPHRTQPSADGILLMGNVCLLGAGDRHHVVCRQWQRELALLRHGSGFRYRTSHRVELNGVPAAAAGVLGWNTQLTGDDFALTLERL